jgi:hypothetical protein
VMTSTPNNAQKRRVRDMEVYVRGRDVHYWTPTGSPEQGCSTLFIESVEQHGRGILSDG